MKQFFSNQQQNSLIGRLKRCLLLSAGLFILGLILSFSVGIFATINQQNVGEQKVAIPKNLAGLQTQVNIIELIAIIFAILLTALAVISLLRTFTRFTGDFRSQLDKLKDATHRLGSGDLAARVSELPDIEFSQLGSNFNAMATSLQQQQTVLKQRDVLESVLQLNTTLTSSLDIHELAAQFLYRALNVLDLQLGALYLYDPTTQLLTLTAAQGFNYDHLEKGFKLGEGTIGRAALHQEPLHLVQPSSAEIGNFQVKTILGNVLPSNIYLVPLTRGNELLGVLGVGSVYPMSEKARNVLNVVASNLSASISNTRAYQHIQMQASELERRNLEQEQANIELRHQRDELTTLNMALEEANQTRSHFLSIMSHELRTPLTSIIGFTQIMMRDPAGHNLTQRQKDNLERILKNSHHLLTLINGVLDLARIEMGRMDVSASEVDLKELLSSLIEETQPIAHARGLILQASAGEDLVPLATDPVKLRQVLLNLVSNAIKFTEEGKVTITITRTPASHIPFHDPTAPEEEYIAIAVKDTGIGIAPEIQERIFDVFYQADSTNTRKYGGAGLGLSTARQLTTLLGGSIEVKSDPGQGSIFTVFLPIRNVHPKDEHDDLPFLKRQQMPLPLKRRTS